MNFSLSFSVVLPLCIYICIGILVKKLNFVDNKTVSSMNKMIFKCLFPLLMFDNVLNAAASGKGMDFPLVLFLLGFTFVLFLLLLLFTPLFLKEKPRQASFIQGAFRSNSVLFAIPIVTSLCGEDYVAVASMSVAVFVPFLNILSVILLESKRSGKVSLLGILKGLATNPLILGAVAGAIFSCLGLQLPSTLAKTVKTLTAMITPLALILLGAGLRLQGIRKNLLPLCSVSLIKLVFVPLAVLFSASQFGFSGQALVCLFSFCCVPTAVSSYTMAEQMGADGEFAGEIVAFTTLLSMGTVFLWVLLLSGMGIV